MAPVVVFMKANTIMIGAAGVYRPPMGGDEGARSGNGPPRRKGPKPGSCKQTDQAAAETRVTVIVVGQGSSRENRGLEEPLRGGGA